MSYRKLGRNSGARKAMFKSLLSAFFTYERIETTEARAKELRKFAEKVITLAKRGDLSARRQAINLVADVDVVETCAPPRRRCANGYHRIGLKISRR